MTFEEIAAIEGHHFPPLHSLFWRNPLPRFDTLDRLIADLAQPPNDPALRAAPEAVVMPVLRHLPGDIDVAGRGGDTGAVVRLMAVCRLPAYAQFAHEHTNSHTLHPPIRRTKHAAYITAAQYS